jgi:long-chain acyl-CoA synthetase
VIKGRKKNVIISRTGENVFPEEIEDQLNRSPYILESVVCGIEDEKHDEKITAKIVPDAEAFIEFSETENVNITPELIRETVGKELEKVNKELPIFKRVTDYEIREDEFEKTTTQKIKRHLVSRE